MVTPAKDGAQAPTAEDSATVQENADIQVAPTAGNTEVAKRGFSDDQLRDLDSLAAIQALLGDQPVAQATDLGNGFAILDANDKARLCRVPVLFIEWTFNKGDQSEFASALAVQLDPTGKVVGKYVVNDGSTGIYQQLKEFTDRTGTNRGLFAPRGLRRSDYDYVNPTTGETSPATTFYIDVSPAA